MRQITKQFGFSLIELMITVALIGILTAVALPAYQEHVQKTRRADAQGALLALANAMERYYVDNRTFVGANPATLYSAKSPVEGTVTYYALEAPTLTRRNFTIQAVPKNVQAKDKCGTLTLTRTGTRGVKDTSLSVDECWRS